MAGRKMRLTQAHVEQVSRKAGEITQSPIPEGRRLTTEEEFKELTRDILEGAPQEGDVWVFAYGSLIWRPEFDHVDKRMALLHGWHRSFCLGWDEWFRGSAGRAGLMLALDRGGRCKGMAYRLPPDALEANMERLVRREMVIMPTVFPPRWVKVTSDRGAFTALTFVIDRTKNNYVSGLSDEAIANALARAIGPRGSMAEYLFHTVAHLEENGIHDRHLWALQEMVAERIEGAS